MSSASSTPPSNPALASAPASGSPEDLFKFRCPVCEGTLNLRRKHFGISGSCVHCKTPLTAVEGPNGPEIRAQAGSTSGLVSESGDAPPPQAEPSTPPAPSSADSIAAIVRGLSTRPTDSEPAPAPAAHSDAPASSPFAPPRVSAPGGLPASLESLNEPDRDRTAPETGAGVNQEPLKREFTAAWNFDPEPPAHSGASLFGTGTSAGGSGFAGTLFGANAQDSPSPFAAPFSGAAAEDSAWPPSSPASSAAEPPAPEEPVVLDDDGRPMKPMTEAEKDLFAAGLHMLESPRRKPGRWRKRLVRVAIVAGALAVVGFGAAAFVPEETRQQWKAKVVEWLEPGMVIVEYLPFDLPGQESAEGSKGPVHRRAFQGLDQVKGEMNSYLDQSSENLGIAPED